METHRVHSVVIVDDEKSFTDMIGSLLQEQLTAPVHTFTRPEEALEKIVKLMPGIVVTDYYMPDMNGVEFIRAVYRLLPDTPCIIITGHSFNVEEYGRDGLKNLKEVLPKPFRSQQLAEMIRRHWKGGNPPANRIL